MIQKAYQVKSLLHFSDELFKLEMILRETLGFNQSMTKMGQLLKMYQLHFILLWLSRHVFNHRFTRYHFHLVSKTDQVLARSHLHHYLRRWHFLCQRLRLILEGRKGSRQTPFEAASHLFWSPKCRVRGLDLCLPDV